MDDYHDSVNGNKTTAFDAMSKRGAPPPKPVRKSASNKKVPPRFTGKVMSTPMVRKTTSAMDLLRAAATASKHASNEPTDAKSKKRAEARKSQARNEHKLEAKEIDDMKARAGTMVPKFVDKVRKELSQAAKAKPKEAAEDWSLPALASLPPAAPAFDGVDKTTEVRSVNASYTSLRHKYASCEGHREMNPDPSCRDLLPPLTRDEAFVIHAKDPQLKLCVTQLYELGDEMWLFGVTSSSATVALELVNLRPFFFLQCPVGAPGGACSEPTSDDILSLQETLNAAVNLPERWEKRYGRARQPPVHSITVEHRVIGTIYEGRRPTAMYRLNFVNLQAFRHYRVGLFKHDIRPFRGYSNILFHETHSPTQMLLNTCDLTLFGHVQVDASKCNLITPDRWDELDKRIHALDEHRDQVRTSVMDSALRGGSSRSDAEIEAAEAVAKAERDFDTEPPVPHDDDDDDDDNDAGNGDDDDDNVASDEDDDNNDKTKDVSMEQARHQQQDDDDDDDMDPRKKKWKKRRKRLQKKKQQARQVRYAARPVYPRTTLHLEGKCELKDLQVLPLTALPPTLQAYFDIETGCEAAIKHYQAKPFSLPNFEDDDSGKSKQPTPPSSSSSSSSSASLLQSSKTSKTSKAKDDDDDDGLLRRSFAEEDSSKEDWRPSFVGRPMYKAKRSAARHASLTAATTRVTGNNTSATNVKQKQRLKRKKAQATLVTGSQPLDVFPNPKKDRDRVIIISTQFAFLGDRRPFLKVLHYLNTVDLRTKDLRDTLCFGFHSGGGDDDGDEKNMLGHWARMLGRFGISILGGFNSINYDLPYVMLRMQKLNSYAGPRGLSKFCEMPNDVRFNPNRVKQCMPSAQRHVKSSNLDMKPHLVPGLDQFDVQRAVKANYKLDSYSLKRCGDKLLKKELSKVDVPPRMISPLFGATAAHRRLLLVYCGRDVDVTFAIAIKCSLVINVMEVARASHTSINQQMMRGQQIKIYNMLLREIERKGWVLSEHHRQIIQKKYNVPCDPVPRYAKPREVFSEAAQAARANTRSRVKMYEGATVLEPHTGFYRRPINCFDFTSLYPSIIITCCLCFSTWIRHERMPDGSLRFPYFDGEPRPLLGAFKGYGAPRIDRYVLWDPRNPRPSDADVGDRALILVADARDGRTEPQCYVVNTSNVFPDLLRKLLDLRAKVKKQMKGMDEDTFEYFVLDAKQAALKIICNSAYGFTGAMEGLFGCLPIAITTCFVGRCWIMFTLAVTEKVFNGKGVYGDTDSVFADLLLATLAALEPYRAEFATDVFQRIMCYIACELITQELQERTGKATSIASLCYEKSMDLFLLIEKKTYVARYCYPLEKRGNFLYKGVNVVRRDKCQLGRDCLSQTFEIAMQSPEPPAAPTAALEAQKRSHAVGIPTDPVHLRAISVYRSAYAAWRKPLLAPLRKALTQLQQVDEDGRSTIPIQLLQRTVSRAAAYKSTANAQSTLIRNIESRTKSTIDVGTRIPWVTILPKGRGRRTVGANKDKLYQYAEEVSWAIEHGERVDRANVLEKEILNPMLRYFANVLDVSVLEDLIQPALATIRSQDENILPLSTFFSSSSSSSSAAAAPCA